MVYFNRDIFGTQDDPRLELYRKGERLVEKILTNLYGLVESMNPESDLCFLMDCGATENGGVYISVSVEPVGE